MPQRQPRVISTEIMIVQQTLRTVKSKYYGILHCSRFVCRARSAGILPEACQPSCATAAAQVEAHGGGRGLRQGDRRSAGSARRGAHDALGAGRTALGRPGWSRHGALARAACFGPDAVLAFCRMAARRCRSSTRSRPAAADSGTFESPVCSRLAEGVSSGPGVGVGATDTGSREGNRSSSSRGDGVSVDRGSGICAGTGIGIRVCACPSASGHRPRPRHWAQGTGG